MADYYSKAAGEVLNELNTSGQGLTREEAELRLSKYGENRLPEKKRKTRTELFFGQFRNYLIFILLVAAVIEIFLNKYTESAAIFIVLLINAVLGYTQEYKAQTSIEALRRIAAPKARAIRDGVRTQIETANLQAQESSLTGESIPVEKILYPLAPNLQMGERRNMLFSGTIIVNGRGAAVVTATGANTEIGKIAELIQAGDESTPLEKKLEQLSRHIGYTVAFVSAVVFIAFEIYKAVRRNNQSFPPK